MNNNNNNIKNLWLGVALALGATFVYLGFGNEVTKEIQSWRYTAPQEKLATAPVGESEETTESLSEQEEGAVGEASPEHGESPKAETPVEQEEKPIAEAPSEEESPTAATLPGEDKMEDLVDSLTSKDSSKFFAEYRLERDRVRGQQADLLKEMAQSATSPEDSRKVAYGRLLSINQNVGKELELEQLLKAKNFEDAVVVMHENAVTIVVKSAELSSKELNIITDLATRTTGRSAKDIVIVPKS